VSALADITRIEFDVSRGVEQAAHGVLDAIERELARQQPDYSQNVLRLAEAYAWLADPSRRHA
jgi:hypothetical protein